MGKPDYEVVKMSKLVSCILRHKPEIIGIKLDLNGWADVNELIRGINSNGNFLDIKLLEKVVAENNKKRFIFNEDKTKIRANQGHSIDVDLEFKQEEPPEFLYHGTTARFLDSIMNEGITKQKRHHVHLSKDIVTAYEVGKRHGDPVVLCIKAGEMYREKFVFYLSENKVWLTKIVPVKYITFDYETN